MSVPVINPNTSVLSFNTGQYVAYQCATLDGQVGTWSIIGANPLPAGLSINATTGMISGVPTTESVINTTIQFTNSNGTATLPVTFGILDSGFVTDYGIEVDVDLISGAVTFPTSADGKLYAKSGDYLMFLVGQKKSGVLLDLPVTGLAFGMKETESENRLILSNGAFTKVGVYDKTRWRMLVYLDPVALKSALGDNEAAAAIGDGALTNPTDPTAITVLPALCEFQFQIGQTDTNLTPSTIQRSSQIFPVLIERAIDS